MQHETNVSANTPVEKVHAGLHADRFLPQRQKKMTTSKNSKRNPEKHQ